MKFHYHLLINQASGGGNGKKTSTKLIELLEKRSYSFTSYFTEYPNHELEIVENLATDILFPWQEEFTDTLDCYPLLIVIGGDGTLHQVVNQLKQMDQKLPIAYIPAGSGNDFARGVGLSREVEKAFRQIIKTQEPRSINVLAYEEKIQETTGISVNNVGIGLDAAIVEHTNQSVTKKNLNKYNLGSLTYISSVFHVLFKQKGFPILVECNGQTYSYKKAFLCTTTNHPYFGGGVAIAPMADAAKPVLDLVLVERLSMFKIAWLIFLLMRKKHATSRYYHHHSASKLRIISTTPQYMQADGEALGEGSYDISYSIQSQLFWF
ncbi:diacylglycerol/lipid kinase family protein [Enterococcus olivae]